MTWSLNPQAALPQSPCWFAPAGISQRRNVLFRARTRLTSAFHQLSIAVEGTYRLWIDGREIGCGPARGGRTSAVVDAWVSTAAVPSGTWIAIEAWCGNLPTFREASEAPALLVDGPRSAWEVLIAQDWCEDAPLWNSQQGHTAWRDLTHEPMGWQTGSDTGIWFAPVTVAISKPLMMRDIVALDERRHDPVTVRYAATVAKLGSLAERNAARVCGEEVHQAPDLERVTGTLGSEGIRIAAGEEGVVLFIEFPSICTAGVIVDIETAAGGCLDLAYGEHLVDGRVRCFQRRSGMADYGFAHRAELRTGIQRVELPPLSKGVRILQLVLRDLRGPAHLHAITGIDRRHPLTAPSTFMTGNRVFNRLWTVGVETIHACALDTLVDCPHREAALWTNDLLVEIPAWLHAGGDPRLAARCIRLVMAHQGPHQLVPGVIPDVQPDGVILSATCAFFPTIVEQYWQWTGDDALVRELLEPLRRQATAVSQWAISPGMLIPPSTVWQFVDWSYESGTGRKLQGKATAVIGWFQVLGLQALARLFQACGDSVAGEICTAEANAHAHGLASLWDETAGCFREWAGEDSPPGAEVVQALAIRSGLLSAPLQAACLAALSTGKLLEADGYMQTQVLLACAEAGDLDAAIARIYRRWIPVAQKSSTLWEALVHQPGDAAFEKSGSLCHGFSCGPLHILQSKILGLQQTAPGWTEARLLPPPSHADWPYAQGTVTTPIGTWHIAWQQTAGLLTGTVDIPPGATLILANGRRLAAGRHSFEECAYRTESTCMVQPKSLMAV